MKIGVFDSGFGGLNILREITALMPEYDYVYLGDSARAPYGSRSQETIYEYTKQSVEFLFKKDCKLVVLACNTASAEALRKIQQEFLPAEYPDRRVLGVLIPACEEAVLKSQNKKIGVIATESTVQSEAFNREINKLNPQIKIYSQACPLLVPIVEAGENDPLIVRTVLEKYLKNLLRKGIDTLILGCTHYGILENEISEVINKMEYEVFLINENRIVSKKLRNYLERHNEIETELSKNKTQVFYSTDLTDKFQKLGEIFMGRVIKVEKIKLD